MTTNWWSISCSSVADESLGVTKKDKVCTLFIKEALMLQQSNIAKKVHLIQYDIQIKWEAKTNKDESLHYNQFKLNVFPFYIHSGWRRLILIVRNWKKKKNCKKYCIYSGFFTLIPWLSLWDNICFQHPVTRKLQLLIEAT